MKSSIEKFEIMSNHPRAESLRIREKLVEYYKLGVVATAGLIAQGRGETFDYLIGEKTTESAFRAIRIAAAVMLQAEHPVISVNGNVAALVAEDVVRLASVTGAQIEVNLFHRSLERELAIENVLKKAGATKIYGVGDKTSRNIVSEVCSERKWVDAKGLFKADVVLVPLEDGDRTQALRNMGKKVIAIDLNPLSRTSQWASISIVDNVVRAIPSLVREAEKMKNMKRNVLRKIVSDFNNGEILADAINKINLRLSELAHKGVFIPEDTEIFQHLIIRRTLPI